MRAVVLVAVLTFAARAFADEPVLPLSDNDLQGARTLSEGGAGRASGLTNDAIFMNPAALGQTQRYALQLSGLHDLQGGEDQFGVSIVDSTETPLSAGLAYNRVLLGPVGSRNALSEFHLALASAISEAIWVGATGKLVHFNDATGVHNKITPDVGVFIKAEPVAIGVVAYNLVDTGSLVAPRQYAGALSIGVGHGLRGEGDVIFDTSTNTDVSLAYHFGASYELLPVLDLRGGYLEDRIRFQRSISGGFGIQVPPGFELDLGYRHDLLGANPERVLAATLDLSI